MPVALDADLEGFVITLAKKHYYFYGFNTPLNNTTSTQIARNKYFTNKILEKAGIPVPKATYIQSEEYKNDLLEERIEELSFPMVAKPMIDGKFGEDVMCNIQNLEQLEQYLNKNIAQSEFISIEEFHKNLKSYRVLICHNRVIGVILRHPAHVLGDGKHTIEELVNISNIKRLKISDTLKPILIDEECHIRLNELGIDLKYIPTINEWVTLCYTCNSSRGGTYVSVNHQICKENQKLLIKAARALNLSLVGFDVLCEDISLPITHSSGVIIEANDSPSVRIHEQAITGDSVLVTRKIIFSLIRRHPFSYLFGLFYNVRTRIYLRTFLFLLILAVGYFLARNMPGGI